MLKNFPEGLGCQSKQNIYSMFMYLFKWTILLSITLKQSQTVRNENPTNRPSEPPSSDTNDIAGYK